MMEAELQENPDPSDPSAIDPQFQQDHWLNTTIL